MAKWDTVGSPLEQHIPVIIIKLDNPEILIEDLIKFADFNKDNKISLSESTDKWHYQNTNLHLYLCQPLIKSFGYDKDYESETLKLNQIISSKSILSRLPNRCHENRDCLYDSHCYASCNMSTNNK
ncbi:unnamed protein product [Rotaria socialis]|uniref:FAM69 protein-kinase domain-containing protein n=1 Tax=Rotaria socialis TaxID=392032 RepID=A0A820QLW3_9BILA|nr:unnamed protein product [Rotaria socialis]CAF3341982.1 unnamed protein product [Rotaria socialis]CAF3350762.1 unnamed protein product [Rotaria socialis]CAF4334551.1 unnamed protein product [Rotaria socialis]CAF4424997.1 unnamed protein product [Rotaria socialis]